MLDLNFNLLYPRYRNGIRILELAPDSEMTRILDVLIYRRVIIVFGFFVFVFAHVYLLRVVFFLIVIRSFIG